jgi:hypothetical protein
MKTNLYLSVIPEALIASQLTPNEFGHYYAVGSQKRSRGQAMFFELDPELKSDYLHLDTLAQRCVPHEDGSPKRSAYLSIYRVLEHVPLAALGTLFLSTDDGRVLGLERAAYQKRPSSGLHLYQEFCPVSPRVASRLDPEEFAQYITDRSNPVSVDRIVFAELRLDALADDPDKGDVSDLPYPHIDHLRDCLKSLQTKQSFASKVVVRDATPSILYRTLLGGFYVADSTGIAYYPLPSREELETRYYAWWRSANSSFLG